MDRSHVYVLLFGAAALLHVSCAAPIVSAPGKLTLPQPGDIRSHVLVEPGMIVAPEVELPAAVQVEHGQAEAALETSAPPVEAPAAPATLPFIDEVERWRPQVRAALEEARAEGRLGGAAGVIDENLVLAVIEQESSGDPEAESEAGALGLMQLMPETFAYFMGLHDWGDDVDDVDPAQMVDVPSNLRAGIRCLAGVLEEQDGSLYWALASYNIAGGTVNRWRAAGLSAVPSWYGETANYAPAILGNYAAHRITAPRSFRG